MHAGISTYGGEPNHGIYIVYFYIVYLFLSLR